MEELLLFNLSPQSLSAVKRAAMIMKIRLKSVEKSQYSSTLESILKNSTVEIYDGEMPEQSMIVLCNIGSKRMNELLNSLRRSSADITYKAVLTRDNIAWTPLKMLEEMESEKKAIEAAK